jgi:hypothetical protein
MSTEIGCTLSKAGSAILSPYRHHKSVRSQTASEEAADPPSSGVAPEAAGGSSAQEASGADTGIVPANDDGTATTTAAANDNAPVGDTGADDEAVADEPAPEPGLEAANTTCQQNHSPQPAQCSDDQCSLQIWFNFVCALP